MKDQEKIITVIEKTLNSMKTAATDAYLEDNQMSPVYVKNTVAFIQKKIKELKQIQR